jgi:hypothetical protein
MLLAIDSSPDGSQLLVWVSASGDNSGIYGSLAIIDADGTGYRALTPDGVVVLEGTTGWSRDAAGSCSPTSTGGC